MKENAINSVEWAHAIGRRVEARRAFVAPTADPVFADPPFGIGPAGVDSRATPLH